MPPSTPVTANLAAALLRYTPSTAVADSLLPAANLTYVQDLRGAHPSTAVARKQARRGVNYAATLASSSSDPATLRIVANMPQKTVKRLAAANPATPDDALDTLSQWAFAQGDTETIEALFATIRPSNWVMRMRAAGWYDTEDPVTREQGYHGRRKRSLPTDVIVAQLERREDPEEIWDTWAMDVIPVNTAIAAAAACSRLCVNISELLEVTRYSTRAAVLDAALNSDADILPDVVVDLVAALTTADLDLWPNQYRKRLSRPRPLTAYAVQQFLRAGIEELDDAVIAALATDQAECDAAQFTLLAARATAESAATLLTKAALRTRLTIEQIDRLAHVADRANTSPKALIEERGPDLKPATVAALLACGNHTVTANWLLGKYPNTPTPQALALLVKDLGKALSQPGWERTHSTMPLESVGELIEQSFAALFTIDTVATPAVRVVLNEAGPATLRMAAAEAPGNAGRQLLPNTNGYTAYLAGELTMRFGDNPAAWAMAAHLADKLELTTGTVANFLDIVEGMLGTAA